MATPSIPLSNNDSIVQAQTQWFPLISLTSLFFMWGFITCLNDILIPYLKGIFDLSYMQAMLVQFCFFFAYFVVSLPAGILVTKIGYKKGIVAGLSIASVGCFMFIPAAQLAVYPLFLLALFVLASGITLLQVSANPYVSALGPNKTAPSRLTLTQAFNALGTTVAPLFGAWLIFDNLAHSAESTSATAVQLPYVLIAISLLVLALIFVFLKLPEMGKQAHEPFSLAKVWKYNHLKLGAIGIFLYVGAEVSIGSFLVSFMQEPHIAGLTESKAASYITYYWGGAMVGRFIGAAVMQYISGNKVLTFNAIMVILLMGVAVVVDGPVAMFAILCVGLFNSIMFPTIFSLAIQNLGASTSHGAGLLCLAIVGGAFVPLLQGVLADSIGVQLSFILPITCYFFIIYYGIKGYRSHVVATKESLT